MKKNRTMRLAALLLVLTLITSCFVGGTFAKYTTAEDISDTARVAKWGVGITTAGTLFAEQYKNTPIAAVDDSSITVQVFDAENVTQNVVAPGTKNETGMTFTITGKPEVDLSLTVAVEATDIVLAKGDDYVDQTVGNMDATFDVAEDYHPVKFTLKNGGDHTLKVGTLAQIESYLEGLTCAKIDSNTDLAVGTTYTSTSDNNYADIDGTYKLTWEWPIGGNEKADTYLGNQGALQPISFEITVTATQID